MYADNPTPNHQRRRRSRLRRPIEPAGGAKGVSPFTALCFGFALGVGPGALAVFLLPSNWFPNEWVRVEVAPAVRDGGQKQIEFPELDGKISTPGATPTAKYQKQAWRLIETLEKHPTPKAQ